MADTATQGGREEGAEGDGMTGISMPKPQIEPAPTNHAQITIGLAMKLDSRHGATLTVVPRKIAEKQGRRKPRSGSAHGKLREAKSAVVHVAWASSQCWEKALEPHGCWAG